MWPVVESFDLENLGCARLRSGAPASPAPHSFCGSAPRGLTSPGLWGAHLLPLAAASAAGAPGVCGSDGAYPLRGSLDQMAGSKLSRGQGPRRAHVRVTAHRAAAGRAGWPEMPAARSWPPWEALCAETVSPATGGPSAPCLPSQQAGSGVSRVYATCLPCVGPQTSFPSPLFAGGARPTLFCAVSPEGPLLRLPWAHLVHMVPAPTGAPSPRCTETPAGAGAWLGLQRRLLREAPGSRRDMCPEMPGPAGVSRLWLW